MVQRQSRGFTLIELMVVLAILGGVVALALPYIGNRNSETKKFMRQFGVLSRELHTRAKLTGETHRLVIQLGNSDKPGQAYWVERSNGRAVIRKDEEEQALLAAADPDEAKPDARAFQIDNSVVKEPRQLPNGLRFDRVELSRAKSAFTGGKVFIHYLPEGLVDEAVILIKGNANQNWTIAIHPLTGRAQIISQALSLQDLRSQ